MRNLTKMGLAVLIVALLLVAAFIPLSSHPPTNGLDTNTQFVMGSDGNLVPHYFGPYPNYATSQLPTVTYNSDGTIASVTGGIQKFIDSLPGLGEAAANNLGNYISVGFPDTTTYPGSDYYEIAVVEYKQQMHSNLTLTTLRGYVQLETAANYANSKHYALTYLNGTAILKYDGTPAIAFDKPQYLGPFIIASKDVPVRVKFTNLLPTGVDGNLFLPVDKTVMGAGMGPIPVVNGDGSVALNPDGSVMYETYTENRANLHLHGGNTPWISDGTPNQWITPAGEDTVYPEGVSVYNVPDMPDPGPGSQTFYYTNQQSARLLFYHDHSYGITRLNVYAGEAAGYLLQDDVEKQLVAEGIIPSVEIPLVIQDKTFVPDDTVPITNMWGTFSSQLAFQDPTWNTSMWGQVGDLWYPHVYMTMENPGDPTGMNSFGRWMYSPWFYPPHDPTYGPVANPYYDPSNPTDPMEPALIPGVPSVSSPGEGFMDTPVVNGVAYPYVNVDPQSYRFRVLNAADDRFFNLQLYVADSSVITADGRINTEVKMVPAIPNDSYPAGWPTDGRPSGVPDPATRGPEMIQIGTEGGFLPAPVVLPNLPINWNYDAGTFDVGNVNQGTLILGPAERADVIIDFSQFAGKTLILFNDAPAPYPANDPRQDYYTGNPDQTDSGGAPSTIAGYGSNTRTIMQIRVSNTTAAAPFDMAALFNAFNTTDTQIGAFEASQNTIIVPQAEYNSAYNETFPENAWVSIFARNITFTPVGYTEPVTMTFKNKAIHDEMGAAYDKEYGRMAVLLGVEQPNPTPATSNVILYNFYDPPTEVVAPALQGAQLGVLADGTQIWKISHNGVDSHVVHWHMFDVQLINRVAWDGILRPPAANELGWKDTLRVDPLQDTFVALRPVTPIVPFDLPNSVRPLDVTKPLGTLLKLDAMDPTGEPIQVINHVVNFGWEYVWHCHMLSHEENDMMRSIVAAVPPRDPSDLAVDLVGNKMVLTWRDNSLGESGFTVQRANDVNFLNGLVSFDVGENTTIYNDTTIVAGQGYYYRVVATNTVGDTWDYTIAHEYNGGIAPGNLAAKGFPTITVRSNPSNVVEPLYGVTTLISVTGSAGPTAVTVTWACSASSGQTGFVVQRATNTAFTQGVRNYTVGTTLLTYTDMTLVNPGTTYYYRVVAVSGVNVGTWSNIMSVTTPV